MRLRQRSDEPPEQFWEIGLQMRLLADTVVLLPAVRAKCGAFRRTYS